MLQLIYSIAGDAINDFDLELFATNFLRGNLGERVSVSNYSAVQAVQALIAESEEPHEVSLLWKGEAYPINRFGALPSQCEAHVESARWPVRVLLAAQKKKRRK